MHTHSSSHHSKSGELSRPQVPVTLPKRLFTNKIATDLQNRDVLNITQALASLDQEDDPNHLEIQSIESMGEKVIGTGSFGVVFQAVVEESNQVVAVKRVVQDRKYKNRELQVMKLLNHPNCVRMITYFYTQDAKSKKTFLNMVLEYVPQTIYSVCRYFAKQRKTMPSFYAKLYTFQLCRSLAYLHGLGICHRDIKPQNMLVDPSKGVVKLADFGSRYYRAPELILGATFYNTYVDVWSLGCVIAEMLLGRPLFPGDSSTDQLAEIIRIIGPPTPVQLSAMHVDPNMLKQFDLSAIPTKSRPLHKLFHPCVDPNAIDLISKFLVYAPQQRLSALESLNHPYFADLCDDPGSRMPDGTQMPPLFNFTEVERSINPSFYAALRKAHTHLPISGSDTASSSSPSPAPVPPHGAAEPAVAAGTAPPADGKTVAGAGAGGADAGQAAQPTLIHHTTTAPAPPTSSTSSYPAPVSSTGAPINASSLSPGKASA